MDTNPNEFLWALKYRPQKVADIILPNSIKATLQSYVDGNDVQNLMLTGTSGIGKTTAAKAIAQELGADTMFVNASLEGGIDNIRNDIAQFSSTVSIIGNGRKIVIMDECLSEDTPVWILRNHEVQKIPISKLKDDTDLVMSYSISKSRIVWAPFHLMDKGVRQDTIEIEFDNGETVICTPEHKWFVYNDEGDVVTVNASELHRYKYVLSP